MTWHRGATRTSQPSWARCELLMTSSTVVHMVYLVRIASLDTAVLPLAAVTASEAAVLNLWQHDRSRAAAAFCSGVSHGVVRTMSTVGGS